MKCSNIAIELTNVSKKYEIHHEKPMLASNIAAMIIVTALGILVFRDESRTFDDWI